MTENLSLDDKAALTSGASWWHTVALPEAGIPAIHMSDGPHGLRTQDDQAADHLGLNQSAPATCFPPAVTLASTWDTALAERVGAALGREARAHGVHVLLGPGVNIKRSPLCGRNFEYFSEDPLLSGVLGVSWVNGLQGQGVGASVKHYAANNQETRRMTVSADVDLRTLREIYLPAFRRVITQADPWTVMCSYNRLNGVHASQNHWLLTEVLRGEWGYTGLVVSDWGAVVDRVKALAAGLDLEMPSSQGAGPARVAAAVRAGDLDEQALERSVARIVGLARKATTDPAATYDRDEHHALAREVAARGAVLLKNDGDLLPLDATAPQRIAVLGEFARTPRYQGAGSSTVNPTRLDDALSAIVAAAPSATVTFAPGFGVDDPHADAAALREEAVRQAVAADVVLLFLGLPPSYESEGYDREHLELPAEQTALLAEVLAANPRVAVILANGGVVRLSGWIHEAPAVLEGWLGGQAGGSATADLLFGVANPSGKLTETIPVRLADTPAHLTWPGDNDHAVYGEGLFVGYRYYDAREMDVTFPFGHGLSYTRFAYSGLRTAAGPDGVDVTVTIANTGSRTGHEVVQVYLGAPGSRVRRAVRELKGFAAVRLEPGQSRAVTIRIPRDDLAYFDLATGSWLVEELDYHVEAGASSRDIRLSATVRVTGDPREPALSADATLAEWLDHPVGGPLITDLLARVRDLVGDVYPEPGSARERGITSMRLSQLVQLPGVPVSQQDLEELMARLDARA
ncbi:glycoside hydrolase family 3 C-terminal domain-containing protein [Nonomuraea typhae]|uniref:glycoside hydrolase family 3 C-terminal domain-containing protein n=1 Tax=Nonomuraea typhae TaxID=2603600 RepID=UPI0012FACE8E|nr:glycoside hydrolase family 3 C-terminal domain-containing protein [Nonomuraea typhae]